MDKKINLYLKLVQTWGWFFFLPKGSACCSSHLDTAWTLIPTKMLYYAWKVLSTKWNVNKACKSCDCCTYFWWSLLWKAIVYCLKLTSCIYLTEQKHQNLHWKKQNKTLS